MEISSMEKTIYLDTGICSGCGACVVACMDQNDIYPEKGSPALRRVYAVEEGQSPDARIVYVSVACQHCEDSPCVMGCPTGAITRHDGTGAVVVREELCIGCRSCALACPFGVPRYDVEGRMRKCRLCVERVEAGLEPACVRVCPTGALRFGPVNAVLGEKEGRFVGTLLRAARRADVQGYR